MTDLTPDDVRRWDPAAVLKVFQVASGRADTLQTFGEDLDQVGQVVGDWDGEAGTAFHSSLGKLRTDIETDGRESRQVASAVDDAWEDVQITKGMMSEVDETADGLGFTITDDWKVDIGNAGLLMGSTEAELEQQILQGELDQVKVKAHTTDHELATAMRAAVGDVQLDQNGREIPQAPPAADGFQPVTAAQLTQIVPGLSPERAAQIVGPLNEAMQQGGMNTPQREAAFISQVAEESDRFNTFEEYADGSQCEGRTDLGNTQPGDGPRYKGRGAIQVTGRYNYTQMSKDLGVDFVDHPELAATPQYAFKTALWYWDTHKGNAVADTGDIVKITEMVNGGTHGLDVRTQFYNNALQVLAH
jgi:putative chitinase